MRTTIFIFCSIILLSVLVLLNFAATLQGHYTFTKKTSLSQLTKTLKLTDLVIWTESRYTRHPSQADRFSSFQDTPGALEHFPAGSFVGVPPSLEVTFEEKDNPGARQ